MKRRSFLKSAAAFSAARAVPIGMSVPFLANKALASSPNYSDIQLDTSIENVKVMPQVINIHMYGGASELAGNMTNIEEINSHSVNDYNALFGAGFANAVEIGGQVTSNDFWQDAGGSEMEEMLSNRDMAIYRTIFKKAWQTRSHRESIYIAQKGTLDIENSPGIGSRLALMLHAYKNQFTQVPLADGTTIPADLNDMVLPFVSFEGDSLSYAPDPNNSIPSNLRGLAIDSNFNNPYRRAPQESEPIESAIESLRLSRLRRTENQRPIYSEAWDSLEKRKDMSDKIERIRGELGSLPSQPDFDSGVQDPDVDDSGVLVYPNNMFASQVQAAVTLALLNPQTLYITLSGSGLGGWDNHIDGASYPDKMKGVMATMRVATKHLRWANDEANKVETISEGSPTRIRTDNIVINLVSEFGRRVNLNNAGGWDHGNNQNLYTFGGQGVRRTKEAAAMGTVIGSTEREGTSMTNNQYNVPVGEKTWEPMSIASTTYSYFGVKNPEIMTSDTTYYPEGSRPFEDLL